MILWSSVFKYWCRGRAEKHAKKSLNYAWYVPLLRCICTPSDHVDSLARVLRDGGMFLCWLSRLSAIPT